MSRKTMKKRMKTSAFFRNYTRLIIGGVILAGVLFCTVFASKLTSYDPGVLDLTNAKQLPSAEHILGTDIYGRDMWSRLLYGGQNTLFIAFVATVIAIAGGAVLGLIIGYYPKLEKYLMRVLEAMRTVPSLILCMLMITVFGSGIPQLILAMSITGIPSRARMIRTQTLSIKEKEFIESEKAMGASDLRTIFIHILPQTTSYLTITFSNEMSANILGMVSLSYLGVGLDPLLPSWGGMVQEGQRVVFGLPHLVLYPSIAIVITVFAMAMLSDGLRDLLDPKLRR